MKPSQALENRGLYLRAYSQAEPAAPKWSIDAHEGERYMQRREEEWYLWLVQDGRFRFVMSCDSLKMITSICRNAIAIPAFTDVWLPIPKPVEGRGRWVRPQHERRY